MNNLIVRKSQLAEVFMPGAPTFGNSFFFDDIPELGRRNIQLYGIEAYTNAQLVQSPKNRPVVDDATKTGITFTLVDNNNSQQVSYMPYFTAIRADNDGFIMLFDGIPITLSQCFITITDGTGINAGDVALFNLYYDEIK